MPIKTPKFWYRGQNSNPPLIETLLSPLSLLYAAGHHINQSLRTPQKFSVPIICVGNIVAGGSGKTPTLDALYGLVLKHKFAQRPFFVSRGYGGKIKSAHRVSLGHDTAHDVGDEPLLLARAGKTIICKRRADGIKEAQGQSADIILMDDGFQNNSVHKDISILVIDGASGFGNEKRLPAGPLRERVADGLSRADAIILIGEDTRNICARIPPSIPIFNAHIQCHFTGNKTKNYIAFCGIARPEKFKQSLSDEHINLCGFHEFADHHNFTALELQKLKDESTQKNAPLITTEKDFVRLPPEFQKSVQTLPIRIEFSDPAALVDFLRRKLDDIK